MGFGTPGHAIVSLRRIDPIFLAEGNGSLEDRTIFLDRAAKLIIHEVGHLYGLDHCSHSRCAMNSIVAAEQFFRLDTNFCSECATKLNFDN